MDAAVEKEVGSRPPYGPPVERGVRHWSGLTERETGLEPATTCLEGRSSTRLSYPRVLHRSLYSIHRSRPRGVLSQHAGQATLTTNARGAGADATSVRVVTGSRAAARRWWHGHRQA